MDQQELMKKIMEIQRDPTLSDAEKAIKRQELLTGKWVPKPSSDDDSNAPGAGPSSAAPEEEDPLDDDTLKCAICMQLCERPVTAPCQHNFCLKCFQDLAAKAKKKACPSCRCDFSAKFMANPRVNTALISAIRAVKSGRKGPASNKPYVRINNDDRPDEAFTTERAQRAGRANAASGRIMVNVPNDHFGPIPPEADPRGTGIRVGEFWRDRLDCRQWGAHFPHVAGIAGQSTVGAQSVVLSGGYEDDRDEGEWFLYTGSGGRDLSGNKRTSKVQSFDQEFTAMNKALLLSCQRGLPVRVVRSHKEKRSAYAPTTDQPVRYDGIYRIVHAWRKKGAQEKLMCRYLFVRCDNEPAPWSSEETGDRPRDLVKDMPGPAAEEMEEARKNGEKVYAMGAKPFWDWDAEKEEWGWAKPPPASQRTASTAGGGSGTSKPRKKVSEHEKALAKMSCGLCKATLTSPVSAPCSHSFCKPCLDERFGGQAFEHDAGAATGRSLRIRKVVMPCPQCKVDLADFLRTAQVNRDMEAMIVKLQRQVEAERAERAAAGEAEGATATGTAAATATEEEEEEGDVGTSPRAADAAVANGNGAAASPTKSAAKKAKKEAPAAAAPAAPVVGIVGTGAQATEADRRALAVATLCSEFTEFDSGLVEALVEQEEGDAQAVRIALAKMRSQMKAEEKKKAKAAAAAVEAQPASPAANGNGNAAAASPAANGGVKRGRSKSGTPAGAKAEANGGAVASPPSAKRAKASPAQQA